MTLLRRIRARLGDERGFTLIEMLVATVLGSIVFMVALNVFDNGRRASARVVDRTAVVASGRTTMDTLTKELHAQTCLGPNYPAITYADDNRVDFYADLGGEVFRPDKYSLVFANGTVTEYVYPPLSDTSWQPPSPVPAGWTPGYSTTPSRTRTLATDLTLVREAGSDTPFFRYFAFSATDPIQPTNRLPTPLGVHDQADSSGKLVPIDDRARTVQILLSFQAHPVNPQSDMVSTTFQNQVYARTADPTDPTHSPQCI